MSAFASRPAPRIRTDTERLTWMLDRLRRDPNPYTLEIWLVMLGLPLALADYDLTLEELRAAIDKEMDS